MYPDSTRVATVSSFRLDTYEVTVGRFRAFVTAGQGTQVSPPAAGAGAHPNISGSGWDPTWNASLVATTAALTTALHCDATYQTWTDTPGAMELRPMTCVDWEEAMAFCAWDGGFLPTESEWNYAASGGSEQRAYPWSNPADSIAIDCTLVNYGGANWPTTACHATGTADVGSFSAGNSRWGQSDLGGNVWEWVLDWYSASYPQPCNDCAMLTPSMYRVFRGGGFDNVADLVRNAARNWFTDTYRAGHLGVRCARAP